MTAATRTRADIEADITKARAKQKRMPAHWEARHAEVAKELELLVNEWLALSEETP